MRKLLSPDGIHPAIDDTVSNYHNDILQEVTQAVAANGVVVVGMKYNPVVSKTRKMLQEAGINFTYLEYGSYTSQWRRRLALKMWSGWATFPMIFVDQTLVGGSSQLQNLLNDPNGEMLSLKRS
jgi:glutaredoxin-related protein